MRKCLVFRVGGDQLNKRVRPYELFYTLKLISFSPFVLQEFPTPFHNIMN